ncbi:putative Sec20 protein [Pseudoloma neurophilia]|uniref:Putative Sec20 protein n=1 Tax=Pseudoloma neurophilia TaxID=146866 RepID=A0A0R0M2E5_9MICR|nr:putative Sec20 protein [Pseudoloma neurophilia]
MEEQIVSILHSDPDDMRVFLNKFNDLLCDYEKHCYINEKIPDFKLINSWMEHVKTKIIIKHENRSILNRREDAEDKNVFDTLSLLVSQVETADQNILLFDNSNIKLKSLSHNTKSLENELLVTQQTIKKTKEAEYKEIRRVHLAFLFFLIIFSYILLSRLLIFKIGVFIGQIFKKIIYRSSRDEL